MHYVRLTLLVFFAASTIQSVHAEPQWPAPKLTDDNYRRWVDFVQPKKHELKWRSIRWHKSLSSAATEAAKLNRPILLWTMNGNPCGET